MRLEAVEIVGFKSFCDRQEVVFRGGVTGIVGPNGCGKSNISDAISWVLGEQSAKSLRGASMEDVIFNGSTARQPLQMAEVRLRVSGLNGNSPDGRPDCVVSRRLYRNGESEYLMNGDVCRLRDVHELFMDTGLGSKAYSIIEQGKIGLILSSKPTDRRALIEEAAGITKYKARRRQTQLKLDAAQQNLLRVNDIVNEVEKQLESLKRQASKARRYRVLKDELQAVERVLYARRFLDLRQSANSLDARLLAEAEREQSLSRTLDTEEGVLETRRQALYQVEGLLEEVRGRLNELTLAVDRHQGQSGYCQQQIAETHTRTEEARREAEQLQARVAPLAESMAIRAEETQRLREDVVAAEAEGRSAEGGVAEASAALLATDQELEQSREAQVLVLGRIATLQNSRTSANSAAERAGAELLKLAGERAELDRDRERVVATRQEADRRQTEQEAQRGGLVEARDAARTRAAEAGGRASEAAREAEALQSERDGLAGRLASLLEMVSTHSAFDEGVRALLASPEDLDVRGVVADNIETESHYERAVEAFLGDRLQAVLVPDAAQAVLGIRHLEASGAGRATFLPLAQAPSRSGCRPLAELARSDAKARGLLSDYYRVTGPHAERIRAVLPDGVLVDSLEDALDLGQRQGPVTCVTLAGETIRGAMVEGGRGGKGLLGPRREVREVTARQQEVEQRLLAVRAKETEERAAADADSQRALELETEIHDVEKELVAIGHALEAAQGEEVRLDRKAAVLDTERAQAEDEQRTAAGRITEIDGLLASAEADRASAAERLAGLAARVTEARAASEAAQQRSSDAKSRLAALRERLAATEADCRRLGRDHQELLARIQGAEARRAEMAERHQQLAAELSLCEAQLAEARLGQERVQAEALVAEEKVREIRVELEGREHALRDRRRERDLIKDAVAELEIERARNGSDLDHLARECHQAIGQTAAEAAAALTDEERTRDLEALASQGQEIRERIERMGAVNVLAVEQSQEYEERHAFLTAQRQDLLDSIAELDRAIRQLDRASRDRFREAFQVINQHFGEIFQQLFGGGTAGLSLLDEDDILESGIDVMAQPPGKRLQNVMLLSGGEKAMTAIALLFAIFQYKPSPFCILDEVDAPLDDANIGRFAKMLDGMKDKTQFVVITHSRKTMEIADQLYGVTMEEPGVSKLVSVRFH
jgi:chromosome segregation protein